MDRRYSAVIITLASYLSRQPFVLARITSKQQYLLHSVPYSSWLSSSLIEGSRRSSPQSRRRLGLQIHSAPGLALLCSASLLQGWR